MQLLANLTTMPGHTYPVYLFVVVGLIAGVVLCLIVGPLDFWSHVYGPLAVCFPLLPLRMPAGRACVRGYDFASRNRSS